MLIFSFLFVSLTVRPIYGVYLPGVPLDLSSRSSSPTPATSNFSYVGVTGPLGWSGLSTANTACSTSGYQSPINLDDTVSNPQQQNIIITILDVEYAQLENLGTTLQVNVHGTTHLEGKEYKLAQFHFHTPSEHRIEEEYFPLEMHFVHQAADGSRLVLSTLFELTEDGSTTELLTAVTANLATVTSRGNTGQTGPLVFKHLIHHFQTTPLYKYTGSLTTPPCVDGVSWLVAEERLPLDLRTYLGLKRVLKFNARYTQGRLGEENLIYMAAKQLPPPFGMELL